MILSEIRFAILTDEANPKALGCGQIGVKVLAILQERELVTYSHAAASPVQKPPRRSLMRNKLVSLLLVILVVFAPWAAAQSGKGIITGRVIDPSGDVVPGAKVLVTDRDTGIALDLKTNNDGYFEALSLIPGTYDVEVQAPNFKTLARKGITVQVEDRINLDLKLEVGQVNESITITAEGPQLRTDDAQTGEVISSDMLQTLPSNNNLGILRDPFLLQTLGRRAGQRPARRLESRS